MYKYESRDFLAEHFSDAKTPKWFCGQVKRSAFKWVACFPAGGMVRVVW